MSAHPNTVFKSFCLSATALILASVPSAAASEPRIEILSTKSGQVATAHLDTHDGMSYLSGTVHRHGAWTNPHVHVALVDKSGKAFATKSVTLTGWQGKPATNPRGTYTASFAANELSRAVAVQVTFQNGLHTFCETDKASTDAKG